MAFLTDVSEIAGKPIGNINGGRRPPYSRKPSALNKARRRSQVTAYEKPSVTRRERLRCRAALRLTQELEPGQGIPKCAGDVQGIAGSRFASEEYMASCRGSDQRDVDEPARGRCRRITTDEFDVVRTTGRHHAAIEVGDLPACAGAWDGQRHQEVFGGSSHGGNIAEIGRRGAKPDVGQCGGAKIKMNA